jgi:carbonic anhydrase
MQKLITGLLDFQNEGFNKHKTLFETLAEGQNPLALFITCSDSRVDPSLLTGTDPGDLFVLRTAGNIIPPYNNALGGEATTIEYAVQVLKIRDIIICGHSQCGAMGGLLTPESIANLHAVKAYLEHAQPCLSIVEDKYSHIADKDTRLARTIEENVLLQLEHIETHPSVTDAVGRGDLKLHGWVYQFETGEVSAYNAEKNAFLPLRANRTPHLLIGCGCSSNFRQIPIRSEAISLAHFALRRAAWGCLDSDWWSISPSIIKVRPCCSNSFCNSSSFSITV